MKKAGVLVLFLFLLSGCMSESAEIERGMALRSKLLQSDGCSFDARITADYGDKLYTFVLACRADAQGNVRFSVLEPESISGITGTVTGEGGALTFDSTALHFELLTDDQLSPVSAPWIFLKTLRSGYLTSAGMEEELLRLTVDDSYEDDALQLDIWLDRRDVPLRGDILYDGKRILTLSVENFEIQ